MQLSAQQLTLSRVQFHHEEKGEALYAMELSLSLERLNFQFSTLFPEAAIAPLEWL